MCGIVGLWDKGAATSILKSRIDAAVKSIRHRGPDDQGVWVSEEAGLGVGHVRLTIIDATPLARQPMISATGRYILVFNGEIYNFRELYDRYCIDDRRVNRRSDTSVLLYLLARYGKKAIGWLNGMFAFAFIDDKEKKILLARDRFGEKPIYLYRKGGTFAFSSELRGIVNLYPDNPWDLDDESIINYHMLGSVPAPRTIYKDVVALLPGHFAEINQSMNVVTQCYWNLSALERLESVNNSDAGIQSECRNLLIGAVKSRMVSDVPVGVFLSGGIDSNAILSTACTCGIPPDKALCIDFEEGAQYSEFAVAKASANYFHIPIQRHVLERHKFEDGMDSFFSAMDQPTIDGFNTYFLSRIASESGIKVWLSGVGGDELFGGYPSFHRIYSLAMLGSLSMLVPDSLVFFIAECLKNIRYSRGLHLGIRGNPLVRAYQACRLILPPAKAKKYLVNAKCLSPGILQSYIDSIYPKSIQGFDCFQVASVFEATVYMRHQLLRDIDNFGMAESIEIRAPFLDHKLFGHVMMLPDDKKKDGQRLKPLLQDIIPGGLPPSVPRNEKRGFTFPVERWLYEGMSSHFRDVALDSVNGQFWNLDEVEDLWRGFKAGQIHWSLLWLFYSFAKWKELHSCKI